MQVERGGGDRRRIIASGWACDLRILCDGRRQIFAFLLPGDTIDLARPQSLGACAVVALTQLVVVGGAERGAVDPEHELERRNLEAAMDATRQDRLYDHLVRIGRLTARERVIHLLLELRDRLDRVGLVKDETFKIPVTQEVLADALGLSVVHINRTLRELRDQGLVVIKSGSVTLNHRAKLASAGCYEPSRAVTRAEPRTFRGASL